MNVHTQPLAVAASFGWSCEYEFEGLEIIEEGILIGEGFSGIAELVHCNDTFRVSRISICGRTRKKAYRPYGYAYWEYANSKLHISDRAPHDSSFQAHLFRKIAERIEESDGASEFFWSEWEAR